MKWDRIRGHDAIVRSFDIAWRKGRLGHAFLFVGPVGVGKHTLARELARAVLCETRSNELKACGRCASCALADAGSHPDLFLAARPEDKVEFPIDVVRELIEHLSLKPARGGRKVAIVDDADDMTAEAANAFLKTLEEPPGASLLILIGGPSPDRQYATIQSRCQIVSFAPLGREELSSLLRANGIDDPVRLDRLVRVAGGSIGQAMALDDESLWEFRKTLLSALAAATLDAFDLSGKWNQYVQEAGTEAAARRRRASLVVKVLLSLLQDALRLSRGVPPLVAGQDDSAILRNLAGRVGTENLLSWIDRVVEADLQISRMVQVELIVEACADALARLSPVIPVNI
jgi:DNA polymerase-3 subunit delta'